MFDCGFFLTTFFFPLPDSEKEKKKKSTQTLYRLIPNSWWMCGVCVCVPCASSTEHLSAKHCICSAGFGCVGEWSSLPYATRQKRSEIENENSAATNHLPPYHATQKPSWPQNERKIYYFFFFQKIYLYSQQSSVVEAY